MVFLERMVSTNKRRGVRTFDFRELTAWSTKLPDVTFAILPPSNSRPNPFATQDRLYASVFSPGAICALEREGGKLAWRRDMPKYSSASVQIHDRKLLAHTPTTLLALSPDSGETLWSFCPYGDEGESIYSSPSATDNCVYIGDRRGYLHCLDADSGKTIWRSLTNGAGGNVNSTPLLVQNLVVVSPTQKTPWRTRQFQESWRGSRNWTARRSLGPSYTKGPFWQCPVRYTCSTRRVEGFSAAFRGGIARFSKPPALHRASLFCLAPRYPALRFRLRTQGRWLRLPQN